MYHIDERTDSRVGRLAVLSDDEWDELPYAQRANFQLCASGFRTGLEAVIRLVRLSRELGGSSAAVVFARSDHAPSSASPGQPALLTAGV